MINMSQECVRGGGKRERQEKREDLSASVILSSCAAQTRSPGRGLVPSRSFEVGGGRGGAGEHARDKTPRSMSIDQAFIHLSTSPRPSLLLYPVYLFVSAVPSLCPVYLFVSAFAFAVSPLSPSLLSPLPALIFSVSISSLAVNCLISATQLGGSGRRDPQSVIWLWLVFDTNLGPFKTG